MQVERIIVNFNPVFGLRNRPRGLKPFSCFSRKRTDLSNKKLHGVCTLTKVYQYPKEERFLFFEPCRTLVDICMELLLNCPICRPKGRDSQNFLVPRVTKRLSAEVAPAQDDSIASMAQIKPNSTQKERERVRKTEAAGGAWGHRESQWTNWLDEPLCSLGKS